MGRVIKGKIKGYEKVLRPSTVKYVCGNKTSCEFSTEDNNLPLNVIDEDIYDVYK